MCNGFLVCASIFSDLFAQGFAQALQALKDGWRALEPHLPWLGTLFGFVMGAWRWWDKREAVVWRRVMRLLADEGKYVQASWAYCVAAIRHPTPATPPQQPAFAVSVLRKVLARRWWHPLHVLTPMTWATNALEAAHCQLDDKDTTISEHRNFALAQRYSAHALQGVVAAAYAAGATDRQARDQLNQSALDKFEEALAVEGKASDAVLLELKALQLRKLGRAADAIAILGELQQSLAQRLQAVLPLTQPERQAILLQLLRVVRHQSEIDHGLGNTAPANTRMVGLIDQPVAAPAFANQLQLQERLERAYYHEVHACIRVRLTRFLDATGAWTLPVNGVAYQSLRNARRDYDALVQQVATSRFSWPLRFWRWLARMDRKDGTLRLRREAAAGLQRLREIETFKGCQLCEPLQRDEVTAPKASG